MPAISITVSRNCECKWQPLSASVFPRCLHARELTLPDFSWAYVDSRTTFTGSRMKLAHSMTRDVRSPCPETPNTRLRFPYRSANPFCTCQLSGRFTYRPLPSSFVLLNFIIIQIEHVVGRVISKNRCKTKRSRASGSSNIQLTTSRFVSLAWMYAARHAYNCCFLRSTEL